MKINSLFCGKGKAGNCFFIVGLYRPARRAEFARLACLRAVAVVAVAVAVALRRAFAHTVCSKRAYTADKRLACSAWLAYMQAAFVARAASVDFATVALAAGKAVVSARFRRARSDRKGNVVTRLPRSGDLRNRLLKAPLSMFSFAYSYKNLNHRRLWRATARNIPRQ